MKQLGSLPSDAAIVACAMDWLAAVDAYRAACIAAEEGDGDTSRIDYLGNTIDGMENTLIAMLRDRQDAEEKVRAAREAEEMSGR